MKTFFFKTFQATKWYLAAIILVVFLMPLPKSKPAYSKAIYSKEGLLLSATISSEQQWCFPMDRLLPDKMAKCMITYEDEYFYAHLGVNPISMVKAGIANFRAGKIVRGASTIPMQVMRMKNRNAKRSFYNKTKEIIGSIKYSLLNKKSRILKEWAELAPFGGNTIGIKAAALRYYGRSIDMLSWGEYALLAVMPNGPTYANLTKNRDILKKKRDFLLKKLQRKGYFDKQELSLYLEEDIPTTTYEIPQQAYHLLKFISNKHPEQFIFRSTIPYESQIKINDWLAQESSFLKMDDIRNISAIVIDIELNELVSYVGNVADPKGRFSYVDIAQAPRSYGSLLKPLLYAHAVDNGHLLPNEMVGDIPTYIGDFQPENFDKKYRGAVPFEEVLIQSLNVPSVRVLNSVGMQSFYDMIKQLDIAYLNKGADHYGLSIILGGGESSLWDLCRIYKGLAQNYIGIQNPFKEVKCFENEVFNSKTNSFSFSPSTMDYLITAMADLTRPREEKAWERYGNDYKIAWKTGTSYGHKDAWALGFNGKYMIGVWVGNEGGEGRFDLTGISKAAPVMFKLFNALPQNHWFSKPPTYQNRETITVCKQSGKIAGPLCKEKKQIIIEKSSLKYSQCNYHQAVYLNNENQMLTEDCIPNAIKKDTIFLLPSYMEYYYKTGHQEYKGIPEIDPNCQTIQSNMKIIYPQNGLKIFLPREAIDKKNDLITKAYHHDKTATLYWFVDDVYVTSTKSSSGHDCKLKISKGQHTISITDQKGFKDDVYFEILEGDSSSK